MPVKITAAAAALAALCASCFFGPPEFGHDAPDDTADQDDTFSETHDQVEDGDAAEDPAQDFPEDGVEAEDDGGGSITLAVDPATSPTPLPSQLVTGLTRAGAGVRIEGGAETAEASAGSDGFFALVVRLRENALNELTVLADDDATGDSVSTRFDRAGGNLDILHNSALPEVRFGGNEAAAAGIADSSAGGDGASFADVDNDGDPDLYATGGAALYVNDGTGSFRTPAGVFLDGARAAVWGDYDNDGDLDLATTDLEGTGLGLYRNEWIETGELGFSDVSSLVPLEPLPNTEGAAWLDYDADGRIDLFVQDGNGNYLFHNREEGTFINESASAGVQIDPANGNWVAVSDFQVDGDVDIVVGNDYPSQLFRNDGDATFDEAASEAGLLFDSNNDDKRGFAFGDFDNDGDFDLFVPGGGLDGSNILFRHEAGGFSDVAAQAGMAGPNLADSAAWGDMDNDGDLDLYLGCDGPNIFYLNHGDGDGDTVPEFENAASDSGVDDGGDAEAVVLVDVDLDGDLDVYVVNDGSPNVFYRNLTDNARSLSVQVRGSGPPGPSVDAMGAVVTLRDGAGALVGAREVNGGQGIGSQAPLVLHFGGTAPSARYSVEVFYPGGGSAAYWVVPFDSAYFFIAGGG
jgi:hypothetical protein